MVCARGEAARDCKAWPWRLPITYEQSVPGTAKPTPDEDMIEKVCNLWLEPADWRCIPTMGATTPEGAAIMDTGVALEAAERYHNIDVDLGRLLTSRGNHVHELRPGVLSFPIKQYQWSGLDLKIIERSGRELAEIVGEAKALLPRFNKAANDPPWEEIAKVLAFLPDNVIAIQHA